MNNHDLKKLYYVRQRHELKEFNQEVRQRLKSFDKQTSEELKDFSNDVKDRESQQHILYTDAEVRGEANARLVVDNDDGWE